ncbi:aromatic-ring-hydroxylating dioxygenase subunit beta [Candidatus Entotheonella palauensis]|uniref:3-phenylpropionate dioxygenase n=1 Tax=Candidatus Entotheonella gemina TaxID=1429439 RepID=W4MGG3_9BACT|nr:3-phenylpropionate/cinnamic acid dioxygenase subunit beta [Candidatus Entotheonella palauensis]ETX09273.1 MAG: hypothetical protein ETSY2_00480 [Candidatus Entotheonella gemina]
MGTVEAAPDPQALARLLLQHEVEQFLYMEARLIDDRKFRDWLDLFTDDVHYWMPTRINRLRDSAADPWEIGRELASADEMAWFDDTKAGLEQRVIRLETGMAWAEEPRSRTRHFVTNVEITLGGHADELQVRANFLVYRSRLETEQDYFVGTREDVLRRVNGQLKIARRKIIYDATVSSAKNLSIFF